MVRRASSFAEKSRDDASSFQLLVAGALRLDTGLGEILAHGTQPFAHALGGPGTRIFAGLPESHESVEVLHELSHCHLAAADAVLVAEPGFLPHAEHLASQFAGVLAGDEFATLLVDSPANRRVPDVLPSLADDFQGRLGAAANVGQFQFLDSRHNFDDTLPLRGAGVNVQVQDDEADIRLGEHLDGKAAFDDVAKGSVEFGNDDRIAGLNLAHHGDELPSLAEFGVPAYALVSPEAPPLVAGGESSAVFEQLVCPLRDVRLGDEGNVLLVGTHPTQTERAGHSSFSEGGSQWH